MPPRPGPLINLWHALGLGFWRLIFCVMNRVEVRGSIPQPEERSIVLLYNHVSAIDPFLVGATAMPFFSKVWWRAPAKEELFRCRIIGAIIGSWGAFPVRRGQRDLASMARMVEMLRASVLVISPEGTRSKDGRLLRGRSGVGKIIYDARPLKAIPVAIRGTQEILPYGKILPRIGRKVTIAYGAPVDLSSFFDLPDCVETSQGIIDAVMEEIARLLGTI